MSFRYNTSGTYLHLITAHPESLTCTPIQLHAAGVLEGVLTATRIYEEVLNMRYLDFGSPTGQASPAVVNFFNQQNAWTNTMISTHLGDPVWQQVRCNDCLFPSDKRPEHVCFRCRHSFVDSRCALLKLCTSCIVLSPQVEQVQEQLTGLMEGYYYAAGLDADLDAASTANNVTEFDFWLLQASGTGCNRL